MIANNESPAYRANPTRTIRRVSIQQKRPQCVAFEILCHWHSDIRL